MHFEQDCYRETALAKKLLKNTAVPTLNLVLEALPKVIQLPQSTKPPKPHKPTVPTQKIETAKSTELPQRRLIRLLPKICNTSAPITYVRDPLAFCQTAEESSSVTHNGHFCAVAWCRQYRETNRWAEPISFHKFPSDEGRKTQWVEALGRIVIYKDEARVCSVHFEPGDYHETEKTALKTTAIPSLNLFLNRLKDSEMAVGQDSKQGRKKIARKEVCEQEKKKMRKEEWIDSKPRISNIIVVDLVKDKKMKYATDSTEPAAVEETCTSCLEMKKDLREVEFQLVQVKRELEEQKKLVDSLRKQMKSC